MTQSLQNIFLMYRCSGVSRGNGSIFGGVFVIYCFKRYIISRSEHKKIWKLQNMLTSMSYNFLPIFKQKFWEKNYGNLKSKKMTKNGQKAKNVSTVFGRICRILSNDPKSAIDNDFLA